MDIVLENKPTKFKKAFNKVRAYFSKPHNVIAVIFAIVLTATVGLPLISLLRDAFVIHHGGESLEFGLPVGAYTLGHWKSLLFEKQYNYTYNFFVKPLVNSVTMALFACLIAIAIGGSLAFLMTRTNLPFKKLISVLFIIPYIMPSWSLAMFWENFFKNSNIVAANQQVGLLQMITGLKVPEWMVYGMFPVSAVLGIHYAPFAYILIGSILRNMDANLEEAATILKSSRFKVIRKVTIPIVMPGIISTVLLVFASSVSSYTVPVFLNKNGLFPTISVTMQSLLMQPSTKGRGFVVAIILLLMSVIILGINSFATGKRKSFTTVTGKSGQASTINLGKAKYPLGVFFAAFVVFFSVVALFTFALESFLRIPGDFSTFTHYYWTTTDQIEGRIAGSSAGILRNVTIWTAMYKTFLLSVIVALLAGSFGILIGYSVAHKRGSKLAGYVANMAFFPYLIPALTFGAVYFSVSYLNAFSFLNGSFLLLVIVASVKFLPFATRSGTSAMMQLSGEIEEASILVGTPWHKRMTKIMFPIQKSSFISGYLLPFISSMRELSLFILIASSGTIVTVVMQNFDINGVTQISNGINLLLTVIIIVVNVIINKVTGASIDKGIGG